MRLLHTTTLELREFSGTDIPPYGILSHTWGRNEFTFKDLQTDGYCGGITKIDGLCRVARGEELSWVWIDTCCIDKSSSAELSEAINSMFQWYKRAVACYVFLEDCEIEKLDGEGPEHLNIPINPFSPLPPTRAEDTDVKNSYNFVDLIHDITSINVIALSTEFEAVHQNFSVAEKMSWAAKRETTRIEDKAYSLMGLFDVNMPLLYGEGENAFFRLQEEIIKKTDDESIFSWGYGEDFTSAGGLFARSPADFLKCRDVTIGEISNSPHYYLTNKGLYIQARISHTDPVLGPFFYAMIHCTDRNLASTKHCIAIPLCYSGNLIFRPPEAIPFMIEEGSSRTAFSKDLVSLYINLTRDPNNSKTFPKPGYMLTQLEPCSTIQMASIYLPWNSLVEVYPPNWRPLYNKTSRPVTVVRNLGSPTTSATVWMRFSPKKWAVSRSLALRLDLVWMLGSRKNSNRLGLALKSVKSLVKLIPGEKPLFVDILENGLLGWEESAPWGERQVSVYWAQGEFEGNIRLYFS
ncbi:HET domain-containing protein [Colletotrichum paranaense]|uniref:HET domain-containing protein n=1 Tax=Colletotrichum paranaense TaxID=1914294 RepID=A0ABQ9SI50_9PEZI|nr:HET domain-containing protein [Colletotrichum paranaense]KAK1535949.1 HET domain-containing protein [Colletotrichum paranaense]